VPPPPPPPVVQAPPPAQQPPQQPAAVVIQPPQQLPPAVAPWWIEFPPQQQALAVVPPQQQALAVARGEEGGARKRTVPVTPHSAQPADRAAFQRPRKGPAGQGNLHELATPKRTPKRTPKSIPQQQPKRLEFDYSSDDLSELDLTGRLQEDDPLLSDRPFDQNQRELDRRTERDLRVAARELRREEQEHREREEPEETALGQTPTASLDWDHGTTWATDMPMEQALADTSGLRGVATERPRPRGRRRPAPEPPVRRSTRKKKSTKRDDEHYY
jgi:hypothetical protein